MAPKNQIQFGKKKGKERLMAPSYVEPRMCEGNVECSTTKEDTSWLSENDIMDISAASISNFYCVFENIPNIVYFLQKFNLPGVTAKNINIERPQGPDKLPVFAHSMTYDDLMLSFIMDENFTSYFTLYKWMFENQYRFYNEDCYTRMMLVILNNAKVPIIRMMFHSVLPTSVDTVSFESQSAEPIIWTANMTYYSYKVDYLSQDLHIPFEYPSFMFSKERRLQAREDRKSVEYPHHPFAHCWK